MDGTAILQSVLSAVLGGVFVLMAQWMRARNEKPKTEAETRKVNAEAAKTAAETWRALYDEVCERLEKLEKKCASLKSLVADVEFLKKDNLRLRRKLNQVIHWYNRLYFQAVEAGLQPENEPPEPEEIE